jgi:hypothetical protein
VRARYANIGQIQNIIGTALGATTKIINDNKKLVKNASGYYDEVLVSAKALKTVSAVGYIVDGTMLSWDVYQIWSNDRYSTSTKMSGTAIAVGGCAAGFAVGYMSVALVNSWNPVGWSMGAVAGVIAVGVITYTALIGISNTQNYLYRRVGIY